MRLAELNGAEVAQMSSSGVFDCISKLVVCFISRYLPLRSIFQPTVMLSLGRHTKWMAPSRMLFAEAKGSFQQPSATLILALFLAVVVSMKLATTLSFIHILQILD
jgi:hypothetical protein